ncbi:MAG: hypothetical protein AB7P94_17355 [Steroidobacteraceae bacterium]
MSVLGNFLFGDSATKPAPFRAPGFQDQGALLNDLAIGQVLGQNPQFQNYNVQSQFGSGNIQPIQPTPNVDLSFQSRSPFQFSNNFNAQQAVGDAFTPAAQQLTNVLGQREQQARSNFLEDQNARGLYTTGATTQGLGDIQQQFSDLLGNNLLGLASQQASQNLGASQFASQQDLNTQINQAAELFRQQGASDEQALNLARNSFLNQASAQIPFQNLLSLLQLSSGAQQGQDQSLGLAGAFASGFGSTL